jgi:hypothetical protein
MIGKITAAEGYGVQAGAVSTSGGGPGSGNRSGLAVGAVVPGPDAARGITLAVGLSRGFHPQVSVKQRDAGVERGGSA